MDGMAAALALLVFASARLDAPAPPDLTAATAALVEKLSSPRFAVREAASKCLARGGVDKAVLRAAAKSADAEVAGRASAALAAARDAEVEALRPLPEIDSAWRDTALHCYRWDRVPEPMRRALQSVGGGDARPYVNYYLATEVWVRERLTAGWTPRFLRLVLADMHHKDADFLERMDEPEAGPLPVDPEWYRSQK